MPVKKQIEVACLVLQEQSGRILATKRPPEKALGLLWEFPGGKLEPGEAPEAALRREIREELHLELGELFPLQMVEHEYPFAHIRLHPFRAFCNARPTIHLTEHVDLRWLDPSDWQALDWAPADIPVLQDLLTGI